MSKSRGVSEEVEAEEDLAPGPCSHQEPINAEIDGALPVAY